MSTFAIPITVSSVCRLVGDVLRHGVLDEADIRVIVRPFMRAIARNGMPLDGDALVPAIVETFRDARVSVDRVLQERRLRLRAPQRNPPDEADALDCYDADVLRALWPQPAALGDPQPQLKLLPAFSSTEDAKSQILTYLEAALERHPRHVGEALIDWFDRALDVEAPESALSRALDLAEAAGIDMLREEFETLLRAGRESRDRVTFPPLGPRKSDIEACPPDDDDLDDFIREYHDEVERRATADREHPTATAPMAGRIAKRTSN